MSANTSSDDAAGRPSASGAAGPAFGDGLAPDGAPSSWSNTPRAGGDGSSGGTRPGPNRSLGRAARANPGYTGNRAHPGRLDPNGTAHHLWSFV